MSNTGMTSNLRNRVSRLRLLLVDDSSVIRQALRDLLQPFQAVEVIGEARNGLMAVHLAMVSRPDVILMDVQMPVLNGIEATRRIKCILPETIIIGLSGLDEPVVQSAMREAGSTAFIPKAYAHTLPQTLLEITGRNVA